MRAPVMAMGWPRLHPLPCTLTSSSSMPRILQAATGTDANASLISQRSTSSGLLPIFSSACMEALAGVFAR